MFWVLMAVYLASSLPSPDAGSRVINILTICAVSFGLRAVTRSRRVLWSGLGATAFYVALMEVLHLVGVATDYRMDTLFVLVVFAFMLGVMGVVTMRRERVTADKIFAAACVFMLMGIFFGLLFVLIEQMAPGSFTLSERDMASLGNSLVHYSFTTLTTVGYGNISPLSAPARSLSDIEAVIAQLYLAIVLARLVSLEMTSGVLERRD